MSADCAGVGSAPGERYGLGGDGYVGGAGGGETRGSAWLQREALTA